MGENNIIIKITSEADLTQAQKELNNLTQKADDLEKEMKDLRKQEEEEIKALKKQAQEWKKSGKVMDQFENEIEKVKRKYSELAKAKREEIESSKGSIKSYTQQINSYKMLNGMSGKAVQQLRAMREELMRMEDAGEFGTKAFMELSIRAAQLEDNIGDVQQRIRVLASDTKHLDFLSGLGEAAAGGFYVVTSAAEVFGDEMEKLQLIFYKVQAAQAVLNGVQAIHNALNKDSAAMVVLNNLVLKLFNREKQKSVALDTAGNVVTKKNITLKGIWAAITVGVTGVTKLLTGAVKSLNKAIKANPIGMLIGGLTIAAGAVAGLVKGFKSLFHTETEQERKLREQREHLEKLRKEYDEFKKGLEDFERTLSMTRENYKSDLELEEREQMRIAKARKASEIEIAQIQEKYAKEKARLAEDDWKLMSKRYDDEMAELENLMRYEKDKDKFEDYHKQWEESYQKQQEYLHKRNEANEEAKAAEQAIEDSRVSVRKQTANELLKIQRDSASKEIKQIELEYKEKLDQVQGSSEEEVALRKALEASKAKEIAEVRKKYAQQEREAELQQQKNLLEAMAQQGGDEEQYQQQLELTRKIAKEEAEIRIASLDKSKMSNKEYAAQVEAIRLELAQSLKQIDDEEANRQAENQRRMTDITIQEANNRKNALRGSEGVDEQKAIVKGYYDALKEQLEENARLEREAVERSTDTEEVKAAKIKAIDAKLQADLEANRKEGAEAELAIDEQYLTDLEIAVSKAEDRLSKAQTTGDKLSALHEQKDAQLALYDEQQNQLEAKWAAGLISYQDYKQQEWEIMKATTDAEVEYQTEAMNAISEGFQTALDFLQQASDLVFEAIQQNIQAEMDALDKEYTTDYEEAQKNANKKYITQKEYDKKKAELEEKQAKYAKTQAIINAAIQTALSIVTTLAQLGATPWGIAAAAIAGAMGAAQIAVIANKPLAQYEKGRKGGKGEYAVVGEKGAEIMYVPEGASIIPHNKIDRPSEWPKYGVPELPHSDPEVLRYVVENSGMGLDIDYDRMGASVAKHLPKQRNVTVNVDRSGVHVNDGSQHTYLNAKYNGSWN